jgi:hypothetical protein
MFVFLISDFHRAMNTDVLVLGFYTDSWPVKMGPTVVTETSSTNLTYTPCKTPKPKYQFSFYFNIIFPLAAKSSLQVLLAKVTYACFIPPVRATCLINFIILDLTLIKCDREMNKVSTSWKNTVRVPSLNARNKSQKLTVVWCCWWKPANTAVLLKSSTAYLTDYTYKFIRFQSATFHIFGSKHSAIIRP